MNRHRHTSRPAAAGSEKTQEIYMQKLNVYTYRSEDGKEMELFLGKED